MVYVRAYLIRIACLIMYIPVNPELFFIFICKITYEIGIRELIAFHCSLDAMCVAVI